MKHKPHWYYISTWYCCLGGCTTVYRTRMYTPKPENEDQRREFVEHACYGCQYGMFL